MNLANGGARPSAIAALVESLAPDVVAAQELSPEQADVLARLLPFGQLAPSCDHHGMGIALRRPGSVRRLPMPYRDAHVTEVQAGGEPGPEAAAVEVINVHIAAPHVPPIWQTQARRQGQLRALEAHLDGVVRRRVVIGDLNATPLWPLYRRLRVRLADAALDIATRQGSRPARTWGPGSGTPRLLRIDHALVQGLHVVGVQVHPLRGSDHSALLVDLAPNGAGPPEAP
jgi:endonuclease/exonuclease/phosphatase (EEP) superfamily protein YafD